MECRNRIIAETVLTLKTVPPLIAFARARGEQTAPKRTDKDRAIEIGRCSRCLMCVGWPIQSLRVFRGGLGVHRGRMTEQDDHGSRHAGHPA